MVGVMEFVIGVLLGLVLAVRGFTLRPDLLIKFQQAIEVFEKKEKKISKPSTEPEAKP